MICCLVVRDLSVGVVRFGVNVTMCIDVVRVGGVAVFFFETQTLITH